METTEMEHGSRKHGNSGHGRPYLMFWVNMILGFVAIYVVMFTMIGRTGGSGKPE
jgi:hypothetical protein